MNKIFTSKAWDDYQHWINNDKKILRRVNELLKDIERGGYEGIGKPEMLRGDLEGFWSRRITSEHRLVYQIDGDNVIIVLCAKHYN